MRKPDSEVGDPSEPEKLETGAPEEVVASSATAVVKSAPEVSVPSKLVLGNAAECKMRQEVAAVSASDLELVRKADACASGTAELGGLVHHKLDTAAKRVDNRPGGVLSSHNGSMVLLASAVRDAAESTKAGSAVVAVAVASEVAGVAV